VALLLLKWHESWIGKLFLQHTTTTQHPLSNTHTYIRSATLVTYGGMSKKPVQIPTSVLIFKDIRLTGFWLSRWMEEHSAKEKTEMFDAIWDLIKNKGLTVWTERYALTSPPLLPSLVH